jgi:uncharacterized protein YuzE
MKITYDPAANAIYVRIRDGQEVGFGETMVDDNGVIVDTDAEGNPRGYEFLSVHEKAPPLESLPEQVSRALSNFISSGSLEADSLVERSYDES